MFFWQPGGVVADRAATAVPRNASEDISDSRSAPREYIYDMAPDSDTWIYKVHQGQRNFRLRGAPVSAMQSHLRETGTWPLVPSGELNRLECGPFVFSPTAESKGVSAQIRFGGGLGELWSQVQARFWRFRGGQV